MLFVVFQNIIDHQQQLIAKLRSAASKSLPNNVSDTYGQPTHQAIGNNL